MSDRVDTKEFVSGYLAEAQEHLASSNANLLAAEEALRRGEPHPRAIRELFRSLHTLKGLSAMIGVEPIVDLSHEMESLLRALDRAGGRLTQPAIDVLLEATRAIESRVGALAKGERIEPAPQRLLETLVAVQRPEAPAAHGELVLPPELAAKLTPGDREQLLLGIGAGRRARRVDFIPSPDRSARGVNITSVRERVGAIAEIVRVLPRTASPGEDAPAGLAFVLIVVTDASDEQLAEAAAARVDAVQPVVVAPSAPPSPEAVPEEVSEARPRTIRVDIARLDEALDRLSAMVVMRSRLQRAAAVLKAQGADTRELHAVLGEHARQLRDLRGAIVRARMVSVTELLERAPLIVRGLTHGTEKRVRLVIEAGRAEVDKGVGDRLVPAVVHLLRNAVDHAVEPAAQRAAAGKPEEATIRISCRESADNELELAVQDDGRGIDADEVSRRAGTSGPATPAELLDILTRPGFTTLERATRTSGRGVGMDVVKRIVGELGGELGLETTPGVGSRFTLRVPLTVTIVEALAFACGEQTFVVPVGAVDDLLEVNPADVLRAPHPAQAAAGAEVRVLRRRDAALPLIRLDELLGMPPRPAARPKAIVVRRDGEPVAFQVDRMIGQQEVVVRPVVDPLVSVPGVAGSTDLGDGHPTLVLDLMALVRAPRAPEVA